MNHKWVLATLAIGLLHASLAAGDTVTVFQNVRIFDGRNGALSAPTNVLIRGNTIERITSADIPTDRSAGTTIINGNGRTLMPGLSDMHWHAMLVRPTPAAIIASDVGYTNLLAGAEASATLMRGFTTIRDLGGPSFGLKRAIDEGVVPGPRIYPSGAIITVTSGHGDFRQFFDVPRTIGGVRSRIEQLGGAMIADSPDEVRLRVREQLMQGASQIKLTAGGGVASPFSPLDVSTFTEPELKAAVEAASNWGTYVSMHAYTSASIQRSIAAGVKVIEHGHLMDDDTAKLMAEKGIWLSMQPFLDIAGAAALRPTGTGQDAAGRDGDGHRLCAGKEVPDQDRVRHGHPVFQGTRREANRHACQPGAMVYAGRNSDHGDRPPMPNCLRYRALAILIPASSACSKRARLPTCSWSTATRSAISGSSKTRPRTSSSS